MAVAFSVMSWNVEKFGTKGDEHRQRIVDTVAERDPNLIAFYETKPSAVWRALMDGLPEYTWHITEGKQTQEIRKICRAAYLALSNRVSSLMFPRASR